jgi:deoxyribodipyrimidine photolyase
VAVLSIGIDWRRGERWFMRMLLDGDEANAGLLGGSGELAR